jgi:hypothetical protein
MPQYSERNLWYPTLELLAQNPAGLTTTDLILELTTRLQPDGHDAEIIARRHDTYFSQKVRNLVGSHRQTALLRDGYVTYDGPGQPITITRSGRGYLEDARGRGEWTGFDVPDAELAARDDMWARLIAGGGPTNVAPAILRDLRIYRGARGIWVDTEATVARDPDGSTATVSVLHTGRAYADDLTDEGVRYHYPATERPGRDAAEISATKRAAERRLPVFVVTTAADPDRRDVRRAYVTGYDDDAATFVLVFSDQPLRVPPRPRQRRSTGFADYRAANETPATAPRVPFSVDPNEVDRALAAHAATQNALADWLGGQGLMPLSPPGGWADFDLAWERGARLWVAEVKSLTDANEARQLRLGLGQVLHYQALLEAEGWEVVPVLVIPRAPNEGRWVALCRRHGVRLVWPGVFETLLEADGPGVAATEPAVQLDPDA